MIEDIESVFFQPLQIRADIIVEIIESRDVGVFVILAGEIKQLLIFALYAMGFHLVVFGFFNSVFEDIALRIGPPGFINHDIVDKILQGLIQDSITGDSWQDKTFFNDKLATFFFQPVDQIGFGLKGGQAFDILHHVFGHREPQGFFNQQVLGIMVLPDVPEITDVTVADIRIPKMFDFVVRVP